MSSKCRTVTIFRPRWRSRVELSPFAEPLALWFQGPGSRCHQSMELSQFQAPMACKCRTVTIFRGTGSRARWRPSVELSPFSDPLALSDLPGNRWRGENAINLILVDGLGTICQYSLGKLRNSDRWRPRRSGREPTGIQERTKENQERPKGNQYETKRDQREPIWNRREPRENREGATMEPSGAKREPSWHHREPRWIHLCSRLNHERTKTSLAQRASDLNRSLSERGLRHPARHGIT